MVDPNTDNGIEYSQSQSKSILCRRNSSGQDKVTRPIHRKRPLAIHRRMTCKHSRWRWSYVWPGSACFGEVPVGAEQHVATERITKKWCCKVKAQHPGRNFSAPGPCAFWVKVMHFFAQGHALLRSRSCTSSPRPPISWFGTTAIAYTVNVLLWSTLSIQNRIIIHTWTNKSPESVDACRLSENWARRSCCQPPSEGLDHNVPAMLVFLELLVTVIISWKKAYTGCVNSALLICGPIVYTRIK